MAYYSVGFTDTTATFMVAGIAAGDEIRLFLRPEPATGDMILDDIFYADDTTFWYDIDGLTPDTDYAANVKAGEDFLGTTYFTTLSRRPTNWSWWSTIASGAEIAITAPEWNAFCERINEFRAYKKRQPYGFSPVSSGTPISAYIVNQGISAISEISNHGSLPEQAYSGGTVSAAFFHALSGTLNCVS